MIGRGGNVITDRLAYAFHVRLVGSVPRRIQRLQDYHVDPRKRRRYLRTRDAARKRYVAKYYDRDIDDSLLYHLVVNTDRVTYEEEAALLILGAVHERIDRTAPVGAAPRAFAPAI